MAESQIICGVFDDKSYGVRPFGGHLTLRGDRISGFLRDLYGRSRVSGTMDREKLEFFKMYDEIERELQRRVLPVDFKFKRENGIWWGTYRIPLSDRTGLAICGTRLCFGNPETSPETLSLEIDKFIADFACRLAPGASSHGRFSDLKSILCNSF